MDISKLRETHGRRLLVEFTCRRCKTKITRPFSECFPEVDYFHNLDDFSPKNGWSGGYTMLCSSCKAAYDEFMNGERK